jgi:hypothetical protein
MDAAVARKSESNSLEQPFDKKCSFFDRYKPENFFHSSEIKPDCNITIAKDIFYNIENLFFLLYKRHFSKMSFRVKKSDVDSFVENFSKITNTWNLMSVASDIKRSFHETLIFKGLYEEMIAQLTYTTEREYEGDYDKTFDAIFLYDTSNSSSVEYLLSLKNQFGYFPDNNSNVHLFQKDEYNNMVLQPYDIKGFDIDINENYDDSFEKTNERILEWCKDFSLENNRIVLLHGEPGSGKTNYIKYLLNQANTVRKIYIPPTYVEALADPAFLGFIKNYSNSLLIIEDAEKILVSREQDDYNSAMSILLNLADGIMGSVLNFKIIATFNTNEERIDKALKRKGRMFLKHYFDKLSKEKTRHLYYKLYNAEPPEERMTLGDIYNSESNGDIKKEKPVIGFAH